MLLDVFTHMRIDYAPFCFAIPVLIIMEGSVVRVEGVLFMESFEKVGEGLT